jgi:hypothetical protein
VLRGVGVALPVAMNAAVVFTANHYVLDMVAGAALALAARVVVSRWSGRRSGHLPVPARSSASAPGPAEPVPVP